MNDHLHPQKLAAWLRTQGATTITISDSGMRALSRWERETHRPVPYVDVPDRIMTRLGLHEWEIPPDVWCDPPSCRDCGVTVTGRMTRCQPCAATRHQRRKADRARKRREANRLIDRALDGLTETNPGEWRREIAA